MVLCGFIACFSKCVPCPRGNRWVVVVHILLFALFFDVKN